MTAYRLAIPADHAFITSYWSSSFRTSDRAGQMPMDPIPVKGVMLDYADVQHAIVEATIARPSSSTVVAIDEESAVLQGFICADHTGGVSRAPGIPSGLPIVYFVCVKSAYRRMGIARGLFRAVAIDPAGAFTYAVRTAIVGKLREKIPLAKYDHLRARYKEGTP